MFAGVLIMLAVYKSNFRMWNHFAYVIYVFSVISLFVVEIAGIARLGAQRWIDLYFFTIQPSELMKLALILSLAKYYSTLSDFEITEVKNHSLPAILIIFPTILVLNQPDLGTAGLLLCTGCGIIFLSGFPKKIFVMLSTIGLAVCPFGWYFLHDYQKNRILTFIDPERDRLGTGYHVLQSKIAIGSGGFFGKGVLKGTQSKLNFLPEKNTDFIFTTIAEEIGFVGGCSIIFLFLALTIYFFYVGSKAKMPFSRLLCYGLGLSLFLHVFINIAMVMGVVPAVGIPLPFLSYGGSSMITFMVGCGLVMSALASKRT
jgi:rod shape determining protein RodA